MTLAGLATDPTRLAIVAHDAGAANHILCWIAAEPKPYRVRFDGPAARLWSERFQEVSPPATLDADLNGVDCLLTGTGWASDLEHAARRAARDRGIRSIAVIDHWVNYRMRFERDGELVLPDEIWVTDDYALTEALRVLGEVPVVVKTNLYLAEQVAKAGRLPDAGDILFVAEPIRDDWGKGTPGEFQGLDYLATHRDAAGIDGGATLRIRPHPSDPPGKYDDWIANHPGSLLDCSSDMGEALRDAKWVAGLQSYALVIALASDRLAISALPPWAPPNCLPHDGLIHLRDLV